MPSEENALQSAHLRLMGLSLGRISFEQLLKSIQFLLRELCAI